MSGPADAGNDLERLLNDLRAKGWPEAKVHSAEEVWEEVCHDPMRRGRGGKGLPQNDAGAAGGPAAPPPLPPVKPDLQELLLRSVDFPLDPPQD